MGHTLSVYIRYCVAHDFQVVKPIKQIVVKHHFAQTIILSGWYTANDSPTLLEFPQTGASHTLSAFATICYNKTISSGIVGHYYTATIR